MVLLCLDGNCWKQCVRYSEPPVNSGKRVFVHETFHGFSLFKNNFKTSQNLLQQFQSHLHQWNSNRIYCRGLCICSWPRCLRTCSWRTYHLAFYFPLRDCSIFNIVYCFHPLDCIPVDNLMKIMQVTCLNFTNGREGKLTWIIPNSSSNEKFMNNSWLV